MTTDHSLLRETAARPWQPLQPGFFVKHLHGERDDEARVLLLKLEPGTVVERHRHEGVVHAFQLAGRRKLLETGEVIGPGSYLHEPAGNVDSWMAVGDEPLLIFVTVSGALEALDDEGNVLKRFTTSSVAASYRAFVAAR